MAEGGPPAPRRSWFERVVALGNDNKLIAVATLVTLATGVPYLVMTVLRTVGGGAGEQDYQALFSAALEVSEARLREQADHQTRITMRSEIERMVSEQVDGLRMLQADAQREGASNADRERLYAAIDQFNAGRANLALKEIGRLADEQEARGDLEQAASTLRRRAALVTPLDGLAAIADRARADALHRGDARATMEWATMVYDYVGQLDALPLYRRAAEQAAASGDEAAEAEAWWWVASCLWQNWPGWTEEKAELRLMALRRANDLLRTLVEREPDDTELAYQFGVVVATRKWHPEEADPEESAAVAAQLDRAMPRFRDDPSPEAALADASLLVARGVLHADAGERRSAADAMVAAAERLRPYVQHGRADMHFVVRAWTTIFQATDLLLKPRIADFTAAEVAAEVAVSIMDVGVMLDPRNPQAYTVAITARQWVLEALAGQERLDEAAAAAEELLTWTRERVEDFGEEGRARANVWHVLAVAARAQALVDVDRARALLAEAESLQGGPDLPEEWSLSHALTPPILDEARARIAAAAASDG